MESLSQIPGLRPGGRDDDRNWFHGSRNACELSGIFNFNSRGTIYSRVEGPVPQRR